MTATTVLIGGPRDGDVLAVQGIEPIRVARLSDGFVADWSPPRIPEAVETVIETYYPETLNFFGVPLLVHLHESLAFGKATRTELGNALGQHLLSDTGKAIVR